MSEATSTWFIRRASSGSDSSSSPSAVRSHAIALLSPLLRIVPYDATPPMAFCRCPSCTASVLTKPPRWMVVVCWPLSDMAAEPSRMKKSLSHTSRSTVSVVPLGSATRSPAAIRRLNWPRES